MLKRYFPLISCFFCLIIAVLTAGCGTTQNGPCGDQPCGTKTPCHPKFAKRAYNKPYQIRGNWYHPQTHYEISEHGTASYYGGTDVFHGRKTSNGERFDMNAVSAAHKTLPLPCVVRITNMENGRSIKVKVNDRGPFIHGRVIDVSRKTAQLLGFYRQGTARVHVETLVSESLELAKSGVNPSRVNASSPIAAVGIKKAPLKLKHDTIRIAQFNQKTSAQKALKKIAAKFKNHKIRIEPVGIGQRTLYRLIAGPFNTPGQAAAFSGYLKKMGYKPTVFEKETS